VERGAELCNGRAKGGDDGRVSDMITRDERYKMDKN
jgi:hypothetical protein